MEKDQKTPGLLSVVDQLRLLSEGIDPYTGELIDFKSLNQSKPARKAVQKLAYEMGITNEQPQYKRTQDERIDGIINRRPTWTEEEIAEVKQETPKQEEKVQQTTPKQEEKIYCVDGGKTHIAGDGANEHGYYKTWDEAFSAYEKYTEDWESSHFKINQCFCGLYYFSVTK